MIRYLKIAHETNGLYFTKVEKSDWCIVCGGSDDIIWSYNTNKPKQEALQSLFDLIVKNSDNGGIWIEDLELLQKELRFDVDIFNKFKDLLDSKNKLQKARTKYRMHKDILEDTIKEMNGKNKKGESNENN